jgi:hypothetical protein
MFFEFPDYFFIQSCGVNPCGNPLPVIAYTFVYLITDTLPLVCKNTNREKKREKKEGKYRKRMQGRVIRNDTNVRIFSLFGVTVASSPGVCNGDFYRGSIFAPPHLTHRTTFEEKTARRLVCMFPHK